MNYWTKEEETYLKNNWNIIKCSELALNRSKSAIYFKAKSLGLKVIPKQSTLLKLLDNSHISLYWIGFLMADGYFSQSGTLSVTLKHTDSDYLNSLANILHTKIHFYTHEPNNIVRLAVTDKINCLLLMTRWDLNNKKTKIPPKKLLELSKEEFYSWVTGFIDGDGSIDKNGSSGSIVSGLEWLNILTEISTFLQETNLEIRKPTSFSKNESLRLRLHSNTLKSLKLHSIKYNLPVMKRKWDRVNLIDKRFSQSR